MKIDNIKKEVTAVLSPLGKIIDMFSSATRLVFIIMAAGAVWFTHTGVITSAEFLVLANGAFVFFYGKSAAQSASRDNIKAQQATTVIAKDGGDDLQKELAEIMSQK